MPDPLEIARSLAPLVEAEADRTEELRTVAPPVVDALAANGMFGMLLPRGMGGMEADAPTTLAVFEELTRADPSTGWSFLANTCTSAFAAVYCGDRAVKAMFPDGQVSVHAGMLGPRGTATVRAGGVTVNGRYSFGSGSAHSGWIGAGAALVDDDGPVLGAGGVPEALVVFVSRDDVTFLDNWDVLGLRGTGSVDYELRDQFVAEDFTFPLLHPTIQRGGHVYRLGVLGFTSLGHSGFALGVGRRALEEVARLAPTKVRMSSRAPVSEDRLFQHDFARHEAALSSARAYAYDIFGRAAEIAAAGNDIDEETLHRLRQVTTYATGVTADLVRAAYGWLGTEGIRATVIQRCLRDIQTATQHTFVDPQTLVAAAPVLLRAYQR